METGIVVDLSDDDDCVVEMARKEMDGKKMNELRKYIPFLEYITTKDPVRNEKYFQLLQWFRRKTEFSVRVATKCENAIKMRYGNLKSSMVFPESIVRIFTEVDLIVISDEDDEPILIGADLSPNLNGRSQISTPIKNNINNKANGIVLGNQMKSFQNDATVKDSSISLIRSCSITNLSGSNTAADDSNGRTKAKQAMAKSSATCDNSSITVEEGEILSDNEKPESSTKSKNRSVSSLSLGSKTIKDNNLALETEDDVHADLFKRIDTLAKDTDEIIGSGIPTWQELEQEEQVHLKKSPILRPKNLDGLFCKKLSRSVFPHTLPSPESDKDEVTNVSHKKKKKKHKHKKRTHNETSNWYISEAENRAEKEEIVSNDSHVTSSIEKNVKKLKKSWKKHKQKKKQCRSLNISDDEEEQVNATHTNKEVLPKTKVTELYNRRDSTKKNMPNENSNSTDVTVVLLDSDDESPPAIVTKSGKTFSISTSPPPNPSPVQASASTAIAITSELISSVSSDIEVPIQNEQASLNTCQLKDLKNMGMQELNEIYSKLCKATGIQLEELLIDLVTTTKTGMDETQPIVEDQSLNQTEDSTEMFNHYNNNFVSNEHDLNKWALQQHHQQKQQDQQQFHQQQQHHQLQQYQIQQYQLQQRHQLQQQHCGLSERSYNYQNSLRPGLNLNDPRIVQKLKQIKDSPIHNLSIRESASFLMNSHASRPINTTNPIAEEVTSKTAKTYGEHKRLRELEKQKKLEQIAKISTMVNNRDETAQNTSNQLKKIESEFESTEQLPKRKITRTISSGSESGSTTSNLKEKQSENEVEQRKIMSFSICQKGRKRILSSSSSSSDDGVLLQNDTLLKDKASSGRLTPFEMKKVVGIVFSAMGQSKENAVETFENLSKSASKQRRNSNRNSKDSAKSDATSPKSPIDNDSAAKNISSKFTGNNLCNEISSAPTKLYNEPKVQIEKKKQTNIEQSKKTKNSAVQRGCRELKNLNCTFSGYKEMFEQNRLDTIDGKRRCSVMTESMMKHQLESFDNNSQKSEENYVPSSREKCVAAPIRKRRQTCSALQTNLIPEKTNLPPIKVVIRRLSESGKFRVKETEQNDSSDNTDEFDIDEHRKVNKISSRSQLQPCVKLRKLSDSEVKKILKVAEDNLVKDDSTSSTLHLSSKSISKLRPESEKHNKKLNLKALCTLSQKDSNSSTVTNKKKIISHEVPILVPLTSKPVFSRLKTVAKPTKYLNDDINMTASSTKVCAICNKRPFDLTNHYVVQHKTESYISRLTSVEIANLETNVTLAVPYRKRYKVLCPFCQDELEDNFNNFYAHYSYHTGEYGFRCDVCEILRPYREDIRSHQHRSSKCRNGKIRTNYLYSPDVTVIYIYVCKLCNFVQLNEANIHKHHRDHHGFVFDDPEHVKKCIIAAIDNGEVVNELLLTCPKEGDFIEQQLPADAVLGNQEFVNEYPLDIKDVILTLESMESENNREYNDIVSTEKNSCTRDHQLIQESGVPETSTKHSLDEVNMDNGPFAATSPEALLAQFHAPQLSNNVMTVIHCANTTPNQESHYPYEKPVQIKPEIQEIKLEPQDSLPSKSETHPIKPRMLYRKLSSDSTYFGLYKCMLEDCWFSTNVAKRFIEHTSSHTNTKDVYLNCAYCPVKNTCAEKLVRHVRSRHSMSRYQCSECSYRSMIPANIIIHRGLYHKDSTAKKCIYECVGRVRKMEDKLIGMKKKMIENVTGMECPDCSLMFYSLSSMKLHIKKEHALNFEALDCTIFHEFACIYCKKESNSMTSMKIHLATEHPDEMGYVVERKLKSNAYLDAIENLNMINISLSVQPADIHPALFNECKNQDCETEKPKLEAENVNADLQLSSEESSPTKAITKEELLVLERIKPLLGLLTENTGVIPSNLYRCIQCNATFFNSELWLAHIKNRHNMSESVDCPHCFKHLALDLLVSHFETHSRHAYICYHCIKSFYSKQKIDEHFTLCHKGSQSVIEKQIPIGKDSYYIVKKEDVPVRDWVVELAKFVDTIRNTCIERQQQHTNREWWEGLTSSCLEEIEIPQYINNEQSHFKCLVRSCPFIGLDENALDLHINEHTVPRNYKCSHCVLNLTTPSWENIKDHKMLHKNDLHICCVCKFIHHKRSMITKHIESLHNSRDVPVLSLWRDSINYKTSLEIVLPPGKTGFATSVVCFCCKEKMKNSTNFVQHLRAEHNITLRLKCDLCDKILLTHVEAKTHNEEHDTKMFALKYDVLATFLYNLTVKSMSPFTIEMRPIQKKRANDDVNTSTSKRIKLNEEPLIKVKEEVVIKTECEEEVVQEDANTSERVGLKCVSIDQLVKEPVSTSSMQEILNRSEQAVIYAKSTATVQMAEPALISASDLQNRRAPHSSATYLSEKYALSQITTNSAMQYSSAYILQNQKHPTSENVITNVILPNNQGKAIISRPLQSYSVSEVSYPKQSNQPFAATTVVSPILQAELCPGINHLKDNLHSEQITQSSINLVGSQDVINVSEITPICENCKMECTDFSHLMTHFEAVHAPKNQRFLFRITRKIECVYCSFRGSLKSLPAHHTTFHPDKARLCRSIIDSSRCGVCHGVFNNLPPFNIPRNPICLCPTSQRILSDCLDKQTFNILLNFGKQFSTTVCVLCKNSFNYLQECLQHISNVHHRNDICPVVRPIRHLLYVCYLCDKNALHIKEVVEHIHNSHLPDIITAGPLADRMMYYNKIGVLYPKGLIVNINDLRNTVFFDEECFKRDIQCVESQYNGTFIN